MAYDLGSIFAEIGVDTRKLDAGLMDAQLKLAKANGTIDSFGQKLTGASTRLITIGAVMAGAIAASLIKVGTSFDDAYDKIRASTGKTGEAFKGLQDDFRKIAATTPASFNDISTAVSTLEQRLGLTGKPLQELSTSLLELSRVTGTDVTTNVNSAAQLFNNWGIATKDQTTTLDFMLKATQQTGVGITDLMSEVTSTGPILRAMGFDFQTSTALLATFSKSGVDAGTATMALKIALKNMAAEGVKDPQEALQKLIEQIKNAGTTTEALTIGMATFGARGAVPMVQAIREGKFNLDELVKSLNNSKDTIKAVGQATYDLKASMTQLGNEIKLAAEPAATKFFNSLINIVKGFNDLSPAAQNARIDIATFGIEVAAGATGLILLAGAAGKVRTAILALSTPMGAIAVEVAAGAVGFYNMASRLNDLSKVIPNTYRSSNDFLKTLQTIAKLGMPTQLVDFFINWTDKILGTDKATGNVIRTTQGWNAAMAESNKNLVATTIATQALLQSTNDTGLSLTALKTELTNLDTSYQNGEITLQEYITGVQNLGVKGKDAQGALTALNDAFVSGAMSPGVYISMLNQLGLTLEQLKAQFASIFSSMFTNFDIQSDLTTATKNYNESLAGTVSGGGGAAKAGKTLHEIQKQQTEQQLALEEATYAVSNAQENLAKVLEGTISTEHEKFDAEKALIEAGYSQIDATENVTKAQKNLDEVMAHGKSTIEDVTNAQYDLTSANFKVSDAQKNLNTIMAHGITTIEDITKAQFSLSDATDAVSIAQKNLDTVMAHGKSSARDITEANFNLTDANYAYVDAQAEYDKVMADNTSTDRDKYEAQKKLTEANFSQIDAQTALDTITAASISTDKEKKDAQEALTKAQFDQTDAQTSLTKAIADSKSTDEEKFTAQQELIKAQQDQITAQDNLTAAIAGSVSTDKEKADAQRQLVEAQLNLEDANYKVIDAQDALNAAMEGVAATDYQVFEAQKALTEALLALTEAQDNLNKSTETATGGGGGHVNTLKEERLMYEALLGPMEANYNALNNILFKTNEQKAALKAQQEEWVNLGLKEVKNGVISGEEFAKKSAAFGISAKDIIAFAEGMNIDVNRLLKDSSVKGVESFINLAQGFGLHGQAIIDKADEVGFDIKAALQDAADKGAENFVALAIDMGFSGSQIIKMAGDWGIALDEGLKARLIKVDKTEADKTIKIFVADLFAIKDKEVKITVDTSRAESQMSSFVTDLQKIQNRNVTVTTTYTNKYGGAMGGIVGHGVGYALGGTIGIPQASSGMVIPQMGRSYLIKAEEYEDIINTSQQRNLAEWIMGKANSRPDGKGGSGGNTFNIYPQTMMDFSDPTNIRLMEQAVARAINK